MFFLLFSLMMLQRTQTPITAAEEIIVSPSGPLEKDSTENDSVIPIKVTIPSTPINVTLPSSIEISFPGDDVNGIIASNLRVINNSKSRTVSLDSIEANVKATDWKLVSESSVNYFQVLSFDSNELYIAIEIEPEKGIYKTDPCGAYLCGNKTCGSNGTSCCYDKCMPVREYEVVYPQILKALMPDDPYQFTKTTRNDWNIIPGNSKSFKLEAKTGGVSSAISGQDIVDIILTFKN